MAKDDFSKMTQTFVNESIVGGGTSRKYTISGTGANASITDTTTYADVPDGSTKHLDAEILNTGNENLNNMIDGKLDYISLDTSATSGDDKDIYDALVALGWTDCIEE